ncbi:diguanylate cyclase [Paraconexibacter sp.]|uniref:GGDEF domain-containing protein n=1 Tax=Paraconexibacter sp. TaxID=2949640 RepID=UPI00356A36A4
MTAVRTPPPPVPRPGHEADRLAAVRRSGVRDSRPDAALDGLVQLAAKLCGTASAEINLVDETDLWFCAARGLGRHGETVPRDLTFCTWTILDPDRPTLVPSAAEDPRFAQNPFVLDGTIGSYAGFPLLSDGQPIGSMCVHDPQPNRLSLDQLEDLRVLATAAQEHLALRRDVAELNELSRTDALTGTANRRAIDDTLARELAQAARRGGHLSVLMADLDRFKAYNDTHGHLAGDLLLQSIARRWRSHLRAGDLLGRWGGEEFCVLLPDCPAQEALVVAERLRADMPEEQTCSIGVASGTAAGAEPGDFIGRADRALYEAKAAGRDRVVPAS